MNIEEGNKLIGIFDGWYQKNLPKNGDINWFHEKYSTKITNKLSIPTNPRYFKYHSSWDWLMPVVEKISKIPLIGATDISDTCYPRTFGMINTENRNVMVRFNAMYLCEAPTLIEAVFFAVVEFIRSENRLKAEINNVKAEK